YPTGRIERRYERWAAAGVILVCVFLPLLHVLIWPDAFRFIACNACDRQRLFYDPLALAGDSEFLALKVVSVGSYVVSLGGVCVIAVLAWRLVGASSAARRFLAPMWLAAFLAAPFIILRGGPANHLVFGIEPTGSTFKALAWGQYLTFSLIP